MNFMFVFEMRSPFDKDLKFYFKLHVPCHITVISEVDQADLEDAF